MLRSIHVIHAAFEVSPEFVATVASDAPELVEALVEACEATRNTRMSWVSNRTVVALSATVRSEQCCRDTSRGDYLHVAGEGWWKITSAGFDPVPDEIAEELERTLP